MNVQYQQGIAVLFRHLPELSQIRPVLEHSGCAVIAANDNADWPEMEGDGVTVTCDGVDFFVDIYPHPWPDEFDNEETNPRLYNAWSAGAFGPFCGEGAFSRALADAPFQPHEHASVTNHNACIRIRTLKSLLDESNAPHALSFQNLTRLAVDMVKIPGAIAFFNPNAELLTSPSEFSSHVELFLGNHLLPILAFTKFRFLDAGEGWQLVDTLGMRQLGQPDHEVSLPPDRSHLATAAIEFTQNVALYAIDSGNAILSNHTADGPGGQPWRAELRPSACFSPPRPAVLHWTTDSHPPEPASLAGEPEPSPIVEASDELAGVIELWLEQRSAIHAKAVKWLGTPEFREFYEQMHFSWSLSALGMLVMPWKAGEIIRMMRQFGPQSKQRWRGYQRLAESGEVWFTVPAIANSQLQHSPTTPVPALLIAPLVQSTGDVVVGGFLSALLADLYRNPSKTLPELSSIMADDEFQIWRRRPIPDAEVGGFPCLALDLKIQGNFLPPEELGFVPILAFPGGNGPAVQIPWHLIAAPRPPPLPGSATAPPLPRASPPPPPFPRSQRPPRPSQSPGCLKSLWNLLVAFVLIAGGLYVLGYAFSLMVGSPDPGSRKTPTQHPSQFMLDQPRAIQQLAKITSIDDYEPLIGEGMQGSGFLMQVSTGHLLGVTSIHQFDGKLPSLLYDLNDNEFRLDPKRAFRQKESQFQQVTEVVGRAPCLTFQSDYSLVQGQTLRVILAKGVFIDGKLHGGRALSKPYQPASGARVFELHTETTENVAGASGSPVINPETGAVVGVLQAADRAERPTRIEFETLAFTLQKPPASKPGPSDASAPSSPSQP